MGPQPQAMARDGGGPPDDFFGKRSYCFGLCGGSSTTAPVMRGKRAERVFYDSATAKRSCLGKLHYCMSCPGWSKSTSMRVVYSRWDVVPVGEVPAKCASCLCDCGGSQKDWLPPPDPKEFKTKVQSDEEESCCTWKVPMGRTLDTFDADIIVDASAHQTLCQICRGEGDVVLYRKAGADLSDPSEVFVMSDVVDPFNVFNETTFELSKINLQGATASALGMRMGATVWNYDARSGADGSAQKKWRGDQETIFYDSLSARRTCLGYCCNLPLCCPPIYKITSERVLYTEWDYWYPCDNPGDTCLCGPIYCLRGCARECCCAVGSSAAAAERRQAAQDKKADEGGSEVPSCAGRCCRCPIGRTAHYFDIDIVADIRAHQSCWQLCLNEGSLYFGRMQGADASHDSRTCAFMNVKYVPEVFAYFDALSYDLSKMDLTSFRQNALRNDMMAGASASSQPMEEL